MVSYVAGLFAIISLLGERVSVSITIAICMGWVLFTGILQFFLIRCPQCGECAFIRPSGATLPWVGRRCHHCDRLY